MSAHWRAFLLWLALRLLWSRRDRQKVKESFEDKDEPGWHPVLMVIA